MGSYLSAHSRRGKDREPHRLCLQPACNWPRDALTANSPSHTSADMWARHSSNSSSTWTGDVCGEADGGASSIRPHPTWATAHLPALLGTTLLGPVPRRATLLVMQTQVTACLQQVQHHQAAAREGACVHRCAAIKAAAAVEQQGQKCIRKEAEKGQEVAGWEH